MCLSQAWVSSLTIWQELVRRSQQLMIKNKKRKRRKRRSK